MPTVNASLTLRRVVMLAITAGVMLPALVIGPFIAMESFRSDAQARIHALMQQYGSTLGSALAQPIWLADPVAAEPMVQAVMSNPDVVAISVEDSALGAFLERSKTTDSDDTLVKQTFPVLKDGTPIGTLTVTMTTRHVRAHLLSQIVKLSAAIALQLVLTLTILYFVLERRIFVPVQSLVLSIRRMAGGDLNSPVQTFQRNDELDRLAQGMDDMRSQLASTLEQVRTFNAELEQRVQERTRDLQVALQDLKSAQTEIERAERMAALGAMVAGISHELNTPIGNCLTVASTLVELSQDFSARMQNGMTRTQLREFTQATADASALIQRNLERAAQLIGSFKQVAVDRTAAHRREFSLDAVLQEIQTTLVAVMRRKGYVIEADFASGLTMDSYPGQLGQVMTNLVNNADLHGLEGREGGRIRMSAQAHGAQQVIIRVEDNGKGIPQEHMGRIFDPFFTTKMGHGGSGLGLNIVHNLVRDVMGGEISVQSTVGEGTCFTITLPRVAPPSQVREITRAPFPTEATQA